MAEAVILGDLELDRVTGLAIDESRRLAIHPWPGAEGDLVQDLGQAGARIWLAGVALGSEAGNRLEALRQAMQRGEPLDFAASAAVAANIEQVMVARLQVYQPPGRLDYYEYQMELVRYVPPPPPTAGGFDAGVLGEIASAVDEAAGAAVDAAAGALAEAAAAKAALDEALAAAEDAVEMVETVMEAVEGLGVIEEILSKAGRAITAWGG
ncbi:MAG: DNA circularization N-terminal domain-containing protein [Bacillota bacterium]